MALIEYVPGNVAFISLQLLQKNWEIGAKLRPKKREIMCMRHLSKLRKHFAFNYSIDELLIGQEKDSPETKYVSTILGKVFSVLFFLKIFLKGREYFSC